MLTTELATLTASQRSVLEDARLDLVRRHGDRFERMNAGQWHLCVTAAVLVQRKLLELVPDSFDPGSQRVRPTQAGLNAIGVLTPAQIMALGVGETYDNMIVNHRRWNRDAHIAASAVDWRTPEAAIAALGVPAELTMTGDGREYHRDGWCQCDKVAHD